MLSTISSACNGDIYYPLLTEGTGVILLAAGCSGIVLGISMKIEEFYRVHHQDMPSESYFIIEAGKASLIEGTKRVLPTASIATAVYLILSSAKVL